MIRGKYVDGRPFITGHVVINLVSPDGSPDVRVAEVSFLVDTGADTSVLSAVTFEKDLGLTIDSARPAGTTTGAGRGRILSYIQPALLLLRHDDRHSVSILSVEFRVLQPEAASSDRPGVPFSLLGRNDVILKGTLTMNAREILLDLPVAN